MCVHHFRWAHIEKGNTMASSTFATEIPGEDPLVHSEHEYGMRYPDGTVRWGRDSANLGFRSIATNDTTREHYNNALRQRANQARVDPEAYIAGHQPIRRTITLAVTEPEDI